MLTTVKRISLIATIALSLAIPFSGQAALLLDGGFETSQLTSPWQFEKYDGDGASLEKNGALVRGQQALKLTGHSDDNELYTVVYQHVAVDDVNFSHGDNIFLEGLIGHLAGSPMGGANVAYIEIAFAHRDNDYRAVDFNNVAQSSYLTSSSATGVFIDAKTTTIKIPKLVLSETVTSIRVAVSFFRGIQSSPDAVAFATSAVQQNLSDTGSAWFDDLKLSKVPESGTLALLFLGLAGIGFARPKKA